MENWRKYLVHISQTTHDVALLIEKNKGVAACVVDDKDVLCGIVTQADLNGINSGTMTSVTSLKDVMNPNPRCMCITDSETDILDYMLTNNVRQLPLVDAERVVKKIKYIDEHDILWIMRPDNIKASILAGFSRRDSIRECVVFLGDELIGFCEWTEFVHSPAIQLYNRGVFGNTVRDVRNRLDPVLHLRPDKVFLMVGTHDLIRNRRVQDIYHDYVELVQKITIKETTKIYIHSVPPVYDICAGNLNERSVKELNDMLHTWAETQYIPYIDLYSLLRGKNDRYTVDGWHLNADGYKLWVSCINQYLRRETH